MIAGTEHSESARPHATPSPAAERRDAQRKRIARIATLAIGAILVGFGGIIARVVMLKLDPPEQLAAAAGGTWSRTSEYARRGDILDREGRIIATSSIGHRLFIDPQEVEDLYSISLDLTHLIGGDPVEYDQKLFARRDTRYVVLNHLLDDVQVDAIRRANLRGVGLEPRLVREYTSDQIGSLIIGKVGFEHTGQGGAEHRFDHRLSATDGAIRYLRDSSGRPLWIEPAGYTSQTDGESVRLSIDLVIQEIAERRIHEAVEEVNAVGGRMVVLDPHSGEVLAMCDLLRQPEGREAVITDPDREKHPSLGRNRCAIDFYEPGSTFKPFIWSVATERGKATPDEILQTPTSDPGYRTPFGRMIRDSHYYGPSTWEKVLIKSMNSGMAIVAQRFTHHEMQDVIRAWGFGRITGAGIPGESKGLVTEPKDWNDYSQTSVAFGHEICVTALQMVQAFSAFARDGSMPQIRFTAIEDDTVVVPVVRQVITPETALQTRTLMHRVMNEGTGQRAKSEKYTMFGKSGTAQMVKPEGGGYFENRYTSGFIAGAPLENPRIIVLCVIDDPDKAINHWGGVVAGQPVRDVIDEILGYLGVEPDLAPDPNRSSVVSARD